MSIRKKVIVFIVAALSFSNAYALKGFLEGESSSGMNKYCQYSNGVIITVKSHKLCPLSID